MNNLHPIRREKYVTARVLYFTVQQEIFGRKYFRTKSNFDLSYGFYFRSAAC